MRVLHGTCYSYAPSGDYQSPNVCDSLQLQIFHFFEPPLLVTEVELALNTMVSLFFVIVISVYQYQYQYSVSVIVILLILLRYWFVRFYIELSFQVKFSQQSASSTLYFIQQSCRTGIIDYIIPVLVDHPVLL
jgi:hypothetical protein